MNALIDPAIDQSLREVEITRIFDAPREVVFRAWTDPKHVAAWWGPRGFTAPKVEVDPRPGGVFSIDMQAPDGTITPAKGVFKEIVPPTRLVFVTRAFEDERGRPRFEVETTVTLAEKGGATHLTLRAVVLVAAVEMAAGVAGMREGWSETLDKLGEVVEGVGAASEKGHSKGTGATVFQVVPGEPLILMSRVFEAPRKLVWEACTTPWHMAAWWGPRGFTNNILEMDVRTGGTWRIEQRAPDGNTYTFWGEYQEVTPMQRLMHTQRFLDSPPAYVTITFEDIGGGTRLTSAIRLDTLEGRDGMLASGMEKGARESLDRLAELLETL
jgi:uncharacterized protein YndB with AHSA1/START domain